MADRKTECSEVESDSCIAGDFLPGHWVQQRVGVLNNLHYSGQLGLDDEVLSSKRTLGE